MDIEVECTQFEPGRRFGLRTLRPFRSGQVITLTPTPAGTSLEVVASGALTGFFALGATVLRGVFERQFKSDYARLKALIESAP